MSVVRKLIETIARWELPATNRFWGNDPTRPMSYETCFGSNGARDYMREVARAALGELDTPIPMILTCPICGGRHIDNGLFATKPHHTHACQHCGLTWRPAIVNTVGVQFLPGFKDDDNAQ